MGVEIETISPGDGEFFCYILASVYILDCCAAYAYSFSDYEIVGNAVLSYTVVTFYGFTAVAKQLVTISLGLHTPQHVFLKPSKCSSLSVLSMLSGILGASLSDLRLTFFLMVFGQVRVQGSDVPSRIALTLSISTFRPISIQNSAFIASRLSSQNSSWNSCFLSVIILS